MKLVKQGAVFTPGRAVKAGLGTALDESIKYGIGLVREDSPVRSGALQEGWYQSDNRIENRVPYAVFQEEGTRYMKGRWMVRRNLKAIERALARNAGKQVSEGLR